MTLLPRNEGSNSPQSAALFPWAAGLALMGFLVGGHLARPATVEAQFQPIGFDSDGDGLSDSLEGTIGLSPDRDDTDRDDWSDSEELARGSDPKDKSDVPSSDKLDLSIDGYSEDGVFHLVVSIFTQGGLSQPHTFNLGLVYRGVPYALPPQIYLPVTDVRVVHARMLTDRVHILDIHIPQSVIDSLQDISFYAMATPEGAHAPTDADALNITMSQGIPFALVSSGSVNPSGSLGPPAGGSAGARGGFYQPLVPGSKVPQGSQQGQVCVQRSRVIGTSGSGLQMQIEEAFCVEGDGFCGGDCTSTLGKTFTVIDPLLLIGG